MSEQKKPNRGNFTVNLASNVGNFVIGVAVAGWLTPYLVRKLGVAAYGLVPLAVTATSYLNLFTTVLNAAVGRFIVIALEEGSLDEADQIFNTAFWCSTLLVMVMAVPAIFLAFHSKYVFSVPSGLEGELTLLLLCVAAAMFITTLAGPFGTASFAQNRFDLANAVNIASTAIRVSVIIALFGLARPRVWHVGAGILVGSLAAFIGTVAIWRRLAPMLSLNLRKARLTTFYHIGGMGTWILVNQVGSLLFLSIDLILVNRLFGARSGGEYGAVLTWSTMLRSFAAVIASVFAPTMVAMYARGDYPRLARYTRRAIRLLGTLVAVPVALVCGLASPLLHLWLGRDFEGLGPLMVILTIHLCINLAVLPLFTIQMATNKVRLPAMVTLAMGGVNLGLAVLLANCSSLGMYGVAIAGAIMLTAKNVLFTPVHAAKLLQMEPLSFLRDILVLAASSLGATGAVWFTARCLGVDSWPKLISFGIAASVILIVAIGSLLVEAEDRRRVMSLARTSLRGVFPSQGLVHGEDGT